MFNKWLMPLQSDSYCTVFVQRHGTGTMGKFFGPITLLGFFYWFIGIHSIIQTPYVLC
jgi:KUP system potassium uptake protein